ncbi:MAG: 3-methyl-2-oxobutanoate hydroxymethyltransferase [Pseudomonadales bacterium]|nr:3-methyl-2-oxobutanoate hydroxymethyltransferase [Pseudomonadales bacterium]
MKPVTVATLLQKKIEQQKFSMVAAYDAIFARAINQAGVDIILVGDSLGMVLQGKETTVSVSIEDMAYHTACVAAGNSHCLIIADMPFMSYTSTEDAVKHARQLMQSGGHMIKMEGGQHLAATISTLVAAGVPVCAHIGLTPQTVNILGGYKVQGRGEAQAQHLIDDAIALEQAGAQVILLECVPEEVAARVDQAVSVPTIGIGAGKYTTGQVLVLHDLLGLNTQPAKFVKNFMQDADSIQAAIAAYHQAVVEQSFPAAEHCFR